MLVFFFNVYNYYSATDAYLIENGYFFPLINVERYAFHAKINWIRKFNQVYLILEKNIISIYFYLIKKLKLSLTIFLSLSND